MRLRTTKAPVASTLTRARPGAIKSAFGEVSGLGFTRRLGSLSLLFALAAAQAAASEEPLSSVADLRYGAALYEYFQGDHLQALSELMVAAARGGIKGHGSSPQLTEGGISLALGLDRRAKAIFETLLAGDAASQPLELRNAAWFHLAELQYAQGKWQEAQQSLAFISGRMDHELEPRCQIMAINLAIHLGELDSAEAQLAALNEASDQRHYLHFNLANAFSRAGLFQRAEQHYRSVSMLPFSSNPQQREEQLALHDRAMTAAGYSQLMQGQYDNAIARFTRVRLGSPWSHQALLGYGWAAVGNEDYRGALQPWQALSDGSLLQPAVQEARLALPFAYEKLGAPGQALQAYRAAEQDFGAEIARIKRMLADLQSLDLAGIARLRSADAAEGAEQVLAADSLYLVELFSLEAFRRAEAGLQNLLQMQAMLVDWQRHLHAWSSMLDEREKNRERQLQAISEKDLDTKLGHMLVQRDAMQGELQRIINSRDYPALLDDEQRELWDIVQRGEATLARLKNAGESVEEYAALLKRYRGLLYWQASQNFPDREWSVRRNIQELDKAIAEARDNFSSLQTVIEAAPDIVPYRQRITALEQRLQTQKAALEKALVLAQGELRTRIAGELNSQRARLENYVAQARLSVARLQDRQLTQNANATSDSSPESQP